MSLIKSEIKFGPPIVKALAAQSQPLVQLRLFDWASDDDYHKEVWAEQVDSHRYRILTPIWDHQYFRYGDIVATTTVYASGNTFEAFDRIETHSDWATIAILPNAPIATTTDVIEALNTVFGEGHWICEVLDNALVIATISPEKALHTDAIEAALDNVGLVQRPGPWCYRFLEAAKAGDRGKALAEFLIGDGDEDDDDGGAVDQNDNASSNEAEKALAG